MPIENIPPFPLPVINENGLTLPQFTDVHEWWKTVHREIYGQDIYIENDSQDGQYIGITAKALHDLYSVAESAYNAYSPSSAQGIGLSRVVKINGLRRKVPTHSSVDVRIIGWPGTVITNGTVSDALGHQWDLPQNTVIPPEAELVVTVIARDPGEIYAAPNTITTIDTATRGWQSVINPEASTSGMPVETDPMLRVRQSISTALPAKSQFESLVGAVAALEGTNRYRGYENPNFSTDENGIPANAIALVVEGGDAGEIAATIFRKKGGGTPTFGTTSYSVIDLAGIPHKIYFSRPRQAEVTISIPIKPLAKFTITKDISIRTAVSNWVNSHKIGDHLYLEEIATPARLISETFPEGDPSFKILPGVKASRSGQILKSEDVMIDFDERVVALATDIILEYARS
jgi:uncharacterized phage protein gp47/JayE